MQQGPGPRPYDVSTRSLIEADPAAWLAWVGLPADGPIHVIESDVSTVLAEVDKAFRVDGPSPWLAHFELQASHDHRLPSRLLRYYALLLHAHALPVESTVIMLRPLADGPEMSGYFEQRGISGNVTIAFSYRVIRVWERPVEEFLGGGLGVLPLAPLANVEPARLPGIMRRLEDRFRREADPVEAEDLRATTILLMGMRYSAQQIRNLGSEMPWWQESSIYIETVEETRLAQLRQDIIDLGTEKFGVPDANTTNALDAINDLEALRPIHRRILRASTWQELLAPEG